MHENYIDYGSFVPCVWGSMNHILYIYRTLGWSLSTAGKLPCSWLTHETPIFGGLCSESGLWTTTSAFLPNQDSNPVDLYLEYQHVHRCGFRDVWLTLMWFCAWVHMRILPYHPRTYQHVQPKCDFNWPHVLSPVLCVEHSLQEQTTCESTWTRSILRYIVMWFQLVSPSLSLSKTQCAIAKEGTGV